MCWELMYMEGTHNQTNIAPKPNNYVLLWYIWGLQMNDNGVELIFNLLDWSMRIWSRGVCGKS